MEIALRRGFYGACGDRSTSAPMHLARCPKCRAAHDAALTDARLRREVAEDLRREALRREMPSSAPEPVRYRTDNERGRMEHFRRHPLCQKLGAPKRRALLEEEEGVKVDVATMGRWLKSRAHARRRQSPTLVSPADYASATHAYAFSCVR